MKRVETQGLSYGIAFLYRYIGDEQGVAVILHCTLGDKKNLAQCLHKWYQWYKYSTIETVWLF